MTKWIMLGVLCALALPGVAQACPYTPLVWQREISQHAIPPMVGQRKHFTWVRDRNRNFIDDELEANAGAAGRVDVTIDVNRCLTPEQIVAAFSPFGKISYVGKLITVVLLDQVYEKDLPRLAALPEVAMVERRELMNPTLDVASAAAEAHKSSIYAGLSAEDQGLDGTGVTIAFIGTGVSDALFSPLSGKRVAGFDATDPSDPGDGSTNPPDTTTHESVMAVLAVGAPVFGQTCRTQAGAGIAQSCAGIASGAKYVNVRQCHVVGGVQTCDSYQKATDWVGMNAKKFGIKVVMSFSSCPDDDGTSAQAQQANYLVGMGLVVVASSSKNPANCQPPGAIGDHIVRAPGSASFVLTVNASNDANTVDRGDDSKWSNFTVGPRRDFNLVTADRNALKPDLSAPGTNLEIVKSGASHLSGVSGTSPAAGLVSGMAALILQKYPAMTPDSVKALLIDSVDSSRNTAFSPATGVWDSALGWGLVRVGSALKAAVAQQADVTFPNCSSAGSNAGQPCNLANGQPTWNNDLDITTSSAPRVNYATTIDAKITNLGPSPAVATVHFGVMIFSAGNNQFHSIGSQQVTVPAMMTVTASQPWTPQSTAHTCAQVSIAFGRDADYSNNMTQRNLQIAPSVYHMQVNNPLFVPAHFEVQAKSERADWVCSVDQPAFDLDPFKECPRDVTITFNAPPGAAIGEQARCQVGVYAQPSAGGERQPVGGVTVVTYVPAPCTIYGQVVDGAGRSLPKARVTLAPGKGEKHTGVELRTAVTDADGVFTLTTVPDVEQELTVQAGKGLVGTLTLRPMCGPSLPRVVLEKDRLRLDYLPPIVVDPRPPIVSTSFPEPSPGLVREALKDSAPAGTSEDSHHCALRERPGTSSSSGTLAAVIALAALGHRTGTRRRRARCATSSRRTS